VSPLVDTPDLDVGTDDAPLHFRTMRNILSLAPMLRLVDRGIVEDLLAAIGEEPAFVEEALKTKEWHTATKEEMGSIQENERWSRVHLPKGHHVIGLKWVF
jgi:hypothetical protein